MTITSLNLEAHKPLLVVAPKRLHLDIRVSPITGRKVLHFPYMTISDIHWGSKFSRAKRVCMALRDFESDELKILGDAFGGQEMTKKDTYHFGPWHRQGIAHVVQKAETAEVTVLDGNHELGLERHLDKPKKIFGITFRKQSLHVDPKGRRLREEHNDDYDARAFETPENQLYWYNIGDTLLHWVGEIDQYLQEKLNKENASVAAWCKKKLKTFINERMGILKAMEQIIDDDPAIDGNIGGHSHMKGFHVTPGGKILINDGSCTDHVQFAVHDKNGNWGLIEHHRDRMEIEMEDGNNYTVYWNDLGLEHFADPPQLIESEYTAKADRLLRLAYYLWPSRDRQNLPGDTTQACDTIDRLMTVLGIDPARRTDSSMPGILYWGLHQQLTSLADLDEKLEKFRVSIPIPGRARERQQQSELALTG